MSGKGALLASRSVFRKPASWTVKCSPLLLLVSGTEYFEWPGVGVFFLLGQSGCSVTVHFPPLCQKRALSSNILSDYQVMLLKMKPKRVGGPMCLDP